MSAPLPVYSDPYAYEPPPEENPGAPEAALGALTAFLASSAAITAVALPATLVAALGSIGIPPIPARRAGRLALAVRMTGRSRYGAPESYLGMPTTRRVAAEEPTMRARYIINAGRRLTRALVDGRLRDATQAEKRYLVAHVAAGRKRREAAARLDDVAQREGPWLQWVATLDDRTTADCRRLDGVVFTVDNPPGIPGAVHPTCRCRAVGWAAGTLRSVA